MVAFLAMIWDTGHAEASAHAAGLMRELESCQPALSHWQKGEGFAICDLGRPDIPARLIGLEKASDHSAGAIFGTLFRKNAFPNGQNPVLHLSGTEAGLIEDSGGRCLTETYWGSYLAVVRTSGGLRVLTDPAGSIPCYYTRQGGVILLFSHLEKCGFLHRLNLTFNVPFLATLLSYDRIQNGETGFQEIGELLGGERLCLSGSDVAIDRVWDPRKIAGNRLDIAPLEAGALLRETTGYCVASWAECHETILVSLSGGLDSAVVLESLRRSNPARDLAAVHFQLGSGDAPEVDYARLAATSSDCSLLEIKVDASTEFNQETAHPPSVRPHRQFVSPGLADYLPADLKAKTGALFTGQGGDHLFRVARNSLGFADHVFHHGISKDTPAELLAAARLSGHSVWSVLGQTLARASGRQGKSGIEEKFEQLRTEVTQPLQGYLDPDWALPDWARATDRLPPGKADQLAAFPHMFQARLHLDTAGALETVHPLISQPLIELCLRLPTYVLSAGGISRGLVREAYSGRLPDEIRLRMTKGSASRFFLDRLAARREHIVDTLKNGQLAAMGLVSKAGLESLVNRDTYRSRQAGSRLTLYYAVESWLGTWRQLRSRI